MEDLKVLHIVNWFPNKQNPNEAIWIMRLIESLEPFSRKNDILHLQVKPGHTFRFRREKHQSFDQKIWEVPVKSWFVIEIITFLLLVRELILKKVNTNYGIINFHIAYPLLTYFHLIKKYIKIPVVIFEHWSEYHFNFGVKRKLPRIQKIFYQKIPVLAVSRNLLNDIKSFSNSTSFKTFVVPNIVDTNIFKPLDLVKSTNPTFFMVSQWKWPKNPLLILNLFSKLLVEQNAAILKIAGFGDLYPQMIEKVKELRIEKNVVFLGILDSREIAEEMNKASAFLHCSEYETFSVVCAEALCCGCPVLLSKNVALSQYINEENGKVINSDEDWIFELRDFIKKQFSYNRNQIATLASENFGKEKVGRLYVSSIISILDGVKK